MISRRSGHRHPHDQPIRRTLRACASRGAVPARAKGVKPQRRRAARLIVYERLIDDERRANASALLSSLQMLLASTGGFDFTGADCMDWMREAGLPRATDRGPWSITNRWSSDKDDLRLALTRHQRIFAACPLSEV